VLYDLKGDTVYGASVAFVPYVEPAADQLQFVTLGVTTLSIFYGIMVKAPDGGVDSAIDSNEQTAKLAGASRIAPRFYELAKLRFGVQGVLLAVIERKTRGNLTDEEAKLLTTVLYELRLRYVEARG
jgi:hypothetical protein